MESIRPPGIAIAGLVLVTQVPLRREAVQLFLSGPADQETRGQALLSETLASLEGESNWLSTSERGASARLRGGGSGLPWG